ncbi:fimbrillin family protein [Parabacteroides sp. PF5-9]|uniref:fimbrillin family protein n=1 Tax=Parabacteroides sp. PF5-9 TaxID=1742404 RepID=UPI0024741BAE|nr:fimbrillin family protein [Parabacteroides sp. PF5-9]MDH6357164.1 hypothetical protein [Parabacteroides sp. PF5-9]
MNLRLLLLSLISFVVFSCGSDSHTEKSSFVPISFATQFSTRGSSLVDASGLAAKGGFKVWAYSHDTQWNTDPAKTALMDNVTVTGTANGTVWNYGEPMNWPNDDHVSFFAYGPTAAASLNSTLTATQGKPVIDYTVAAAVANQTDLLIASPVYDQLGGMYTSGNSVGLFFNHALSRIVFSGVLMDETDNRTIKVKEIRLNGLYYKGTTPLVNPVVWDIDDTVTADYTLNISTGTLSNTTPLTTTAQNISTSTGMLFLMPQNIAREVGKDPVMDVTLEIDGSEFKYSSLVFSPGEWQPDKSYNYQIAVDGNELQIIMIDADLTLAQWGSNIMVQPISLDNPKLNDQMSNEEKNNEITRVKNKDEARIHSALNAFVLLNKKNLADNVPNNVKYYAIYLRNDVSHDVEIDMTAYSGDDDFTEGEQIIFDIEKLITGWGDNGTRYYEFKVIYDAAKWKPVDARQPPGNPIPLMNDNEVDAYTSATTVAPVTPASAINYIGSIILERL